MNFPNELERDDQGKVIAATDWLGNRIHVGDRVIYCIAAGRGQQLAIGVLEELRPHLDEDYTRYTVINDPGSNYKMGGWNHKPGDPRKRHMENGQEVWVVYATYEYAETKIRRIAASGWDGKSEKGARFVNEMNVTSLEGLQEAVSKL